MRERLEYKWAASQVKCLTCDAGDVQSIQRALRLPGSVVGHHVVLIQDGVSGSTPAVGTRRKGKIRRLNNLPDTGVWGGERG